jgi:hypothetical protein
MRWAWHIACIGEVSNVYKIFIGKPKGKRPLRRTRHGWEDNIQMYLGEIEFGVVA